MRLQSHRKARTINGTAYLHLSFEICKGFSFFFLQAWTFNINLFILAGGSPNHFVLRLETPLNVQQEQHEFFEGFPLLFQV